MNWLDDKVREWDLGPEVEAEFNRLMLYQGGFIHAATTAAFDRMIKGVRDFVNDHLF